MRLLQQYLINVLIHFSVVIPGIVLTKSEIEMSKQLESQHTAFSKYRRTLRTTADSAKTPEKTDIAAIKKEPGLIVPKTEPGVMGSKKELGNPVSKAAAAGSKKETNVLGRKPGRRKEKLDKLPADCGVESQMRLEGLVNRMKQALGDTSPSGKASKAKGTPKKSGYVDVGFITDEWSKASSETDPALMRLAKPCSVVLGGKKLVRKKSGNSRKDLKRKSSSSCSQASDIKIKKGRLRYQPKI